MLGEIIIKAMVLAAGIGLFGVLFFVWLNRKDSSLDERRYDHGFDPGDMVAPYRIAEDAHPRPSNKPSPNSET